MNSYSSAKAPKNWPSEVIYTSVPVFPNASDRAITFNIRDITAVDQLAKSTSIHIKRITDSNHPAFQQYGLFATKNIPPDTPVILYAGLVTPRDSSNDDSDYVLGFGPSLAIDALNTGSTMPSS